MASKHYIIGELNIQENLEKGQQKTDEEILNEIIEKCGLDPKKEEYSHQEQELLRTYWHSVENGDEQSITRYETLLAQENNNIQKALIKLAQEIQTQAEFETKEPETQSKKTKRKSLMSMINQAKEDNEVEIGLIQAGQLLHWSGLEEKSSYSPSESKKFSQTVKWYLKEGKSPQEIISLNGVEPNQSQGTQNQPTQQQMENIAEVTADAQTQLFMDAVTSPQALADEQAFLEIVRRKKWEKIAQLVENGELVQKIQEQRAKMLKNMNQFPVFEVTATPINPECLPKNQTKQLPSQSQNGN